MKKLVNISMIYFIAAIVCGVFYREFTKYMAFTGKTALAVAHTHLFMLGMFLFLILALFCKNTDLAADNMFKRFLTVYNIGLPLMAVMLIVRGVAQVTELSLGRGADAAISGIAGISHIMLTAAMAFLFLALKKQAAADGRGGR